jgi:hypothetical protein
MKNENKRGARLSGLLILLLLCSNVATALVAFFVIDRTNERYAAELNATVPGLHEVMLLAQESTNTHRAALNLQLAADESEKKESWDRLIEARLREKQRLRQVFPEEPAESSLRAPLWIAAQAYGANVERHLELVRAGDRNRVAEHRANVLRPAFDEYQRRQREESIRLSFEAMRSGAEISALVTTQKGLLLGFGLWPVLLLVLVGVLGAWLWHYVKKMDAEQDGLAPGEHARF